MGFFDSIGDAFTGAWSWTKGAVSDVYNSVLKPVGQDAYNMVAKPAMNFEGELFNTGSTVAKAGGRFAEGTASNLLKVEQGLGNFISSPFFYIGIGLVAVIVIPKLVDRL
jgi:hypothetical protein